MGIDVAGAIADAYAPVGSPATDDIDRLLAARASGQDGTNIDALLSARAGGGLARAGASRATPVTPTQRFTQGVTDIPTGLGQIAEHVAETPLNWLRRGIRGALNVAGATDAAQLFGDVSTQDFDNIVSQREQGYQQARAQVGQTGVDWWRIGGQAVAMAPMMFAGGPAAAGGWRIAQSSALGGTQGLMQPSTDPGNFWQDKLKGGAFGAVTGAAVGGLVEGAASGLRWGVNALRSRYGAPQPGSGEAAAQAETVVNETLKAQGVDPKTVNLDVVKGMRQEVADALQEGAQPNPVSIANRAKAESLPVPVRLTRGQATGDPKLFSDEVNLRGITGVGEPITARLQQQNQAFIANLDMLGAKNAPDPVSTGQQISERVQNYWDALDSRKNDLYSAVRNSQGQPAMMDQFTAAQNIRDALDTPQASHAWDLLPSHIQKTIGDLEEGKLPLTVAQMQALDKAWGADARAADGSTAYAINTARRLLNEAPIQDDVGQEARQAYQAARAAHAQQMSLIDPKLPNGMPNPQYQPLLKAVVMDGKPPETLFDSGFMKAAPSVGSKNLAFLQQLDPQAPQTIGRTLMGEIKRTALSSASDERGTVSQATLSGWANDPVKSARLDALLPQPAAQTFRNLASTVEAVKRAPVASTVNTSNTGSALVNAATSALKTGAFEKFSRGVSQIPVIGPVVNAKTIAEGVKQARLQQGVESALNPGVTLNRLMGTTLAGRAARSGAARALTTGATARKNTESTVE
jgi:hypothetical protein